MSPNVPIITPPMSLRQNWPCSVSWLVADAGKSGVVGGQVRADCVRWQSAGKARYPTNRRLGLVEGRPPYTSERMPPLTRSYTLKLPSLRCITINNMYKSCNFLSLQNTGLMGHWGAVRAQSCEYYIHTTVSEGPIIPFGVHLGLRWRDKLHEYDPPHVCIRGCNPHSDNYCSIPRISYLLVQIQYARSAFQKESVF